MDAAPGACFRPTALGFPNNFATPAAFNTATTQVRYIPADNRTGYVQSWHFTRRSANCAKTSCSMSATSAITRRSDDPGRCEPGGAEPLLDQNLSVNARRPIPNFTTIEEAFAGGFGSYNALQVKLEKRYSRRSLLPELVHLVESDRQRARPSRKLQRR